MWERLKQFLNPFDARYEEMTRTNWPLVALRDTSAGLIVAMMAIPMAMGFAIASGLRPEHGILAGAVAGLVGGAVRRLQVQRVRTGGSPDPRHCRRSWKPTGLRRIPTRAMASWC